MVDDIGNKAIPADREPGDIYKAIAERHLATSAIRVQQIWLKKKKAGRD